MSSIHTTLLVVLDFRKQAFDLKSVSIKRILCSVDCGKWLTDCIQQGARSLYFETGQPAETGHCGDKWNRSWLIDSLIHQSPSWLTLTQSPSWLLSDTDSVTDSVTESTVSWPIQHDLALTARDWASARSRSLVGYGENHKRNNQRTRQNKPITAIFSVHWTGEWGLELIGTWSRTLTTQVFDYSAHYFY